MRSTIARRIDRAALAIIKLVLRLVQREYLIASAYLRRIGAQTPSREYGGSRSMIYQQLLQRSTSTRELIQARARYRAHNADGAVSDELGGVLRIIAYRLRSMPFIGVRLETLVRADDAKMAQAVFTYPVDCKRVTAAYDDMPFKLPRRHHQSQYPLLKRSGH